MTTRTLTMPRLGETMEEGTIVGWLVAPGQKFQRGAAILEIETDKTSMEVPAIAAGTLTDIRFGVGEVAKVGAVVAVVAGAGGAIAAARQGEPVASRSLEAKPASQSPLTPATAGAQTDSTKELGPRFRRDERVIVQAQTSRDFSYSNMSPWREVRTPERNYGPARNMTGRHVTPLARRLASERGIDLNRIAGSGPQGRIVAADIDKAPAAGTGAQATPQYYLVADIEIGRLLAMTESVSSSAHAPEVNRAATAWSALLAAKELAGRERATGAAGFGTSTFSPEAHRSLLRLAAEQDSAIATFRRLATSEQITAWDAALGDTVQADVDRMRAIAWNAPFGSDVRSVPAKAWFAAATRRIDAMKVIEDRAAIDIVALVDGLARSAGMRFWGLTGFLVLVVAGTIAFSIVLARNITRPIADLTGWTRRLAENDTALAIRGHDRRDEIGDMVRALEVLRRHAVERLRLDETVRTDRDRERDRRAGMERVVEEFRSSVSSMLVSMETETSTVRTTAATLADLARSAETDAGVVETATAGASSNVQAVAAATEELAASIREIAGQTQRVNAVVAEASQSAQATDRDVSSLADAAERIGTVVGLIRDIAGQTNLLALNATIEAARAGEAGRGFAVVAAEVKSLAQQTAQATTEIADQVAGIQTSTRNAVDAIRGISRTVEDIAGVTAVIASAVEEQEAVTREIAASVQGVSDGTAVVVDNMHGVNDVIRATAGEAGQVNAASDALSLTTARLSQEVAQFLNDVAA